MVALYRIILMMGGTAAIMLPFMINNTDPVLGFFLGFIGGALGFQCWKMAIRLRHEEN
jgi:hypothetical protein